MADNYDATAQYDDGSCEFEGQPQVIPDSEQYVLGCMDEAAANYNADADYDDGNQCQYLGGCTNALADNYDATAQYDDGSCEFEGQPQVIPDSEQYLLGCLDPAAANYNADADYDDGNQCQYLGGCTNALADNYDATAQYDDGSCEFEGQPQVIPDSEQYVLGCMDEAATNFDPTAQYDDGNQCVYIGGCTNELADNYDATAQYDDGSCTFDNNPSSIPDSYDYNAGCTDPDATNYNPSFTTDDGSCLYIEGCMNELADNYNPEAQYDLGSCIFDGQAQVVIESAEYVGGCTDPEALNTNSSADYDDGSCEYVYGCTQEGADNFNPAAQYDDGSCTFTPIGLDTSDEATYTLGCTDPAAANFDETADYDDGNQCQYVGGCTNELADNYDATAQYDNGSCVFEGQPQVIPDSEQYVLGCMDEAASNYNEAAQYDDGNQCEYIGGCTNELADNYDATAQYDDGSCVFEGSPSSVPSDLDSYQLGCTDPAAANFDETADYDDGNQCEYIGGCTNELADNYDATAQYDNGSCVFEGQPQVIPDSEQYVLGCMDEAASNYNEAAQYDDGNQCEYIGGCTQEAASNYNPAADYDDGSCEFISQDFTPEDVAYNFFCTDPNATNYVNPALLEGVAGYASDNSLCEYAEGCTQENALNYEAGAGVDDGSCLYDFSVTADQVIPFDVAQTIAVNCGFSAAAAGFGGDNTITIGDINNAAEAQTGSPCFTIGGTTIAPQDASYIPVCPDPNATNYYDATQEFINELQGVIVVPTMDACLYSYGCTNVSALNFDSTAGVDDGSCLFSSFSSNYGITLDQALNIVQNQCPDNLVVQGVAAYTGTFTLGSLNDFAEEILGEPCFLLNPPIAPDVESVEYIGGCTNELADNYNPDADYDDQSCTFENYQETLSGCDDPAAENNGSSEPCVFADVEYDLTAFDQGGQSYVGGCLNELADNYNPDADYDDESCTFSTYEANNTGCMNPDAENFDASATIAGSCTFAEVQYDLTDVDAGGDLYIGGCMNPQALNYNPEADYDDESCDFSNLMGCTQNAASNYNPAAQVDDGSCVFIPTDFEPASIVYGCTYEAATNFNPTAEVDDGSCTFTPDSCSLGEDPTPEPTGGGGAGLGTSPDPNRPS